jgi:hypothetical protein
MKITANGSGGFAGISEHYVIDTDASPAGKTLEAALDDSGFFAAAAAPQAAPPKVGADLVRWTITVEDGGRTQTIRFADDGAPGQNERWHALLARIRAAA